MFINDLIIEKMFIEEEKTGDPYEKSDADTMLKYINPDFEIPKSVALFSRRYCPYTEKAREILEQNKINYDEYVLNKHFGIKTLVALSGSTMLPQVLIQGERIGGADELENYFKLNQKK